MNSAERDAAGERDRRSAPRPSGRDDADQSTLAFGGVPAGHPRRHPARPRAACHAGDLAAADHRFDPATGLIMMAGIYYGAKSWFDDVDPAEHPGRLAARFGLASPRWSPATPADRAAAAGGVLAQHSAGAGAIQDAGVTAMYGHDVSGCRLCASRCSEKDVVLWEGHHNTLIHDWGFWRVG